MHDACRSCGAFRPGHVCSSCGAFQSLTPTAAELDAEVDLLEWQMHHDRRSGNRAYARRRKLELSILRCSIARRRRTRPGAHRLITGSDQ